MTRSDNLLAAADKAQAAITGLITARAFDGRDPARQQALIIEAEAALYAAIDLIWQSKESARERFVRVAGEITAAPYETQDERLVA